MNEQKISYELNLCMIFVLFRRKSYEVTRHLFESSPGTGIDLAAINIQRGRDHGIAPYNVWRSVCQLEPASSFTTGPGGFVDHPSDAVLAMKSIYKYVN